MKEETFTGNPGNFQSLLQFRCDAGDIGLKEHMSTCGGNVTYRSKTIQNEIVEVLGSVVKTALIDKVKEAKFFSVLCDEVQDVSSTEQVTFIVRYVEKEDDMFVIRESFIGFKEQHRNMTGSTLAATILGKIEELGLDCCMIRGQGWQWLNGWLDQRGKRHHFQAIPFCHLYTLCEPHSESVYCPILHNIRSDSEHDGCFERSQQIL